MTFLKSIVIIIIISFCVEPSFDKVMKWQISWNDAADTVICLELFKKSNSFFLLCLNIHA